MAEICSPDAAQVVTVTTQCIAKLWLQNVLAPVGLLTISVPPPPSQNGWTNRSCVYNRIFLLLYFTAVHFLPGALIPTSEAFSQIAHFCFALAGSDDVVLIATMAAKTAIYHT